MRVRKREYVVSVLLFVLIIGLPAHARIQHLNERNRSWTERVVIGMPGDNEEVTLCHCPPGNPGECQTTTVVGAAGSAHLSHENDYLGECDSGECSAYPVRVAATGQTISYAPGDDGDHQNGVSVDPRFTDNGDGTVTDNLTGLIWLKEVNCFGIRSWNEALSDISTLATGSCGLTDGSVAGDWRMPNINELLSLIDYSQCCPALPVGHPFPELTESPYWTSTDVVIFGQRWTVNVYYIGLTTTTGTTSSWPVRGPE